MIAAIVIGTAGGVLSGLLGVGGGILFVPALTLALSLSQIKAEATCWLASFELVPSSNGPRKPPKFPVMLMNPMAEAAALAPRNIVGIDQKGGM